MQIQSPGLAAQLAQLKTASQAPETCGRLPAALHALIMACLARLFGRLEQLLALWQSGLLPASRDPEHRAGPALPQRVATPQHKPIRRHARLPRLHAQPVIPSTANNPRLRAAPPAPQHNPSHQARSRHSFVPSYFRPHSARAPPASDHRCRVTPLWQRRRTAP